MLDFLRKSAASWVAKILFLLLIISFGAWGIGDYLRPNPNRPVATVGDATISPAEFSQAYRRELDRWSQRFGRAVPRDVAEQLGLPQQVLRNLVVRHALAQEAKGLGVLVGDDEIRRSILANPAFRGADGRFDQARFQQVLANNGYNEASFVELLRGQLTIEAVDGSVATPGEVPVAEAEAIYRFREEKRSAELMLLPDKDVPAPAAPSDADLKAYYEAHKDQFTAPEYRAVTMLVVHPDDLAGQHQPSEADIRAAYDFRVAEFRVPGTRTVTQILYSDEAKAKDAESRLAAGTAPAEVAKATEGKLTDLGTVKETELFPKELATAAFAQKAPGVAAPVKTVLGWHVLIVTAVQAEHEQPLAEVHDRIAKELAREAAADAMPKLVNGIEDKIAAGATIEEAAKAAGLEPAKIAAVDASGLDPEGKQVPAVQPGSDMLSAIFDAREGQDTPIADLKDGGFYVARVDKVTASHVKAFDEVKAAVVADVNKEHLDKAARTEADTLAERVRKGETLADVAKSKNLTVRTPAPFLRTANDAASWLPDTLVARIFAAKKGDVVVAASPDGHIVARVTDVAAPDPAAAKDAVAALRKQLSAPLAGDMAQQFTDGLQSRYGVNVDESNLKRLL